MKLPLEQYVHLLRSAAEPTRLRILALLATAELSVTDIAAVLGQSQPRVSRHLKVLCDAGLLSRSREQHWIYYRVPSEGSAARWVRELLGHDDVTIDTAGSGREALQALRTEPYDCAVLDLRLPDMSGFEVLEELGADSKLSDVPVVVFTGRELSAEEDARLHTMAALWSSARASKAASLNPSGNRISVMFCRYRRVAALLRGLSPVASWNAASSSRYGRSILNVAP